MPHITPFLWFDTQAEEAARFYATVFPNSKVSHVWNGPDGKAQGVNFILDGQEVRALNGGPMYQPTEAFSFFVDCATQEEIDQYWNALTADGGQEGQCGWLKDKFGLSWQIIPTALGKYIGDSKSGNSKAALEAMLKMKKIVLADLEAAYQQPK